MFTTPSSIFATRSGIALCALFIGVQPTLGQFDDIGGSGSMFGDVNLDGPRELSADAPAVIDEANYVPPALRKKLTWEADEISLSAFAVELSDRIGIPVLVDEIAMTDVGIPTDEPVSVMLDDESAYLALERLQRQLGLGWFVRDRIVHLTTIEIADGEYFPVAYNVADLLETGCTMTSLANTFRIVIEDGWEHVDGIGGNITHAGTVLVVNLRDAPHRDVAALLDALRQPRLRAVVADSPRWQKIEEQLDQQNRSVQFADVPLVDALAQLAEQSSLPIVIEEDALNDVGIPLDEPITLDLKDRSARAILRVILKELGLTIFNRDGQLVVTTSELANEAFSIVAHDVSDICHTERDTETLVHVLENMMGTFWQNLYGSGGDAAIPRVGTLVVSQTYSGHRAVDDLLAQLRQKLDGRTLSGAEEAAVNDEEVITRFYHLPSAQAGDLAKLLPRQIAVGTWDMTENDAPGTLAVISDEPTFRDEGGSDGDKKNIVAHPRAILMVKHRREVLRMVEQFLDDMNSDSCGRRSGQFGGGFF